MQLPGGTKRRRVSEPIELARIEALLHSGARLPAAYVAVSRVAPDRRQKKVRIFDERRDGRLTVDLAELRRAHPGQLVRFQLRERGQVLQTAQWHIPGVEPAPGGPVVQGSPSSKRERASGEPEGAPEGLVRARQEAGHLAAEVHRLRAELAVAEAARNRAEGERDEARQAEERGRERCDRLREQLQVAAVENKEFEIVLRLLIDRVPADVQEVLRFVRDGE